MTEINPNIIPQGLLQEPAFIALQESAQNQEKPKTVKMPLPTAAENAYFLDVEKGDAYGIKTDKRTPLMEKVFGPTNMRQRIQEAAQNATFNNGDYFVDGVSVTKGLFGQDRPGMSPEAIFKAKREIELKSLLNAGKQVETITGWDATTGSFNKEKVSVEGLETRARDLGLLNPGSPYINQSGALSPSKDMRALEKAVLQKEKERAALKVAKANNINVNALKGKSIDEMEYLIRDARRQTGLNQGRQKVLFDAETEDIRTLQENGYDTSQIQALKSGKGLSPQGSKGLNPVSGAQRVQQRAASTGNPQVDALINKHFSLNDGTPQALAKSLRSRNKIIEGVGEAMISNAVAFGSPQSQYDRAWKTYNEKTRKFENNQTHLRNLEAKEAEFQFKRDQQRMDHEQRQFEIRETNKMLREQYEKELEIEESRRADADFDNLTRMIMGMAGNL